LYGKNSYLCSFDNESIVLAVLIFVAISPFVKSLTYSTGFPAQSYPAGISLPGGTTEFGPIAQPLSNFAPSKITLLNPTKTSSSIVQE
jgi:hypothetical protein